MSIGDKYTCPKCGFIVRIKLDIDEPRRIVNCVKCDKEMNIHNRYRSDKILNRPKKAHYLHKSLLN